MSILVILLPPRPRLGARTPGGDAPATVRAGTELRWVLSPDGLALQDQGRAAPALLPRADSVVAVLPDADVSWQRLTLPKAPPARMRAALLGALEETLLDDEDTLHVALPPQAVPGQPAWVAAVNRPWLAGQLAALEAAGVDVDRVVPSSWPGEAAQGHFFDSGEGDGHAVTLAWSDPQGAASLQLAGNLPRALLPAGDTTPVRWTASAAAAAAAEAWLGAPVALQSDAERALQAARSLWNLRQFDLARRNRGAQAARGFGKRFLSPAWRPVRIGLVALLGLQVLALNAWAWRQQKTVDELRQAQVALLREAHPQVRAVLDAPAQMQRENDVLRSAAGRAGEGDLESLLGAAAMAWPASQGPVQSLRFEPGKLTLAAAGWPDAQVAEFRARLLPGGWTVEAAEGRVTLGVAKAAP